TTPIPTLPTPSGHPSAPSRPYLWQTAVNTLRLNPWTGLGLDTFRFHYQENLTYAPTPIYHTHNVYLELFLAVGLLGLFPLLLASYYLTPTLSPPSNPYQPFLLLSLILLFAHGFIDLFLLANPLAYLCWLLIALLHTFPPNGP
ncbi:MAG TPA: O-antigen ligase family protein, partial [Anaerolineae bacterium]|nr:O-antigen ligase family protein [Anaerolineae bacterium]